MDQLLSVFNYTIKILLQKYPLTLLPVMSTIHRIQQCRHKRKLTFITVPADVHEKLLPVNIHQTLHGDVDACLLVNSKMMNKCTLGANVAWFQLAQFPPDSFNKKIIVKAVGVADVESSTVIVTETTYFNIKHHLMIPLLTDDFKVTLDNVTGILDNVAVHTLFVPTIATNASVGLLQSPIDIDHEIVDIILGSYFETPRYLCPGDLFNIDVHQYAPHLRFSTCLQGANIVFKVLNIEGPEYKCPRNVICGYFVVKDFTTMVQSANQQGFLPRCTSFFCDTGINPTVLNFKTFIVSNCPSGLNEFSVELAASIQPFLHYAPLKTHGVRPVFLVYGPNGAGKQKVIKCVGKTFGMNVWCIDCLDLKGTAPGYTEKKIQIIFKKVKQLSPCVVVLRNIDNLCKDHEGNDDSRIISAFHEQLAHLYEENQTLPVIVVGMYNTNCNNTSAIAPGLAREFVHTVHLGSPNEAQRAEILNWIVRKCSVKLHPDVSIKHVAARSSGFLYEDLKALVSHAVRFRCRMYKQLTMEEELVCSEENCVMQSDFDEALDLMHTAYSGAIGAPKIPAVLWNDIGGLLPLKEEIKRTITMPLQHPELVASGLRRSGILLYGPPGTGKTLLAKAVATECNLNFLSVKGPELLNMYVGQSEENVREVFERARAASPCIIFFDELDSLAPNRGRSGDSAGVMDRVVSQLLAEMDGMQKSTHLYIIGATNRPDLIDPALLRPGRFDKLLYVGVCDDEDSQLSVLVALTRKFHMSPDMNLRDVVAQLPQNLTGADLFSICSNAWLNAVKKCISGKESEAGGSRSHSSALVVDMQDFSAAIEKLAPSVTAEDLAYFHQLHRKLAAK